MPGSLIFFCGLEGRAKTSSGLDVLLFLADVWSVHRVTGDIPGQLRRDSGDTSVGRAMTDSNVRKMIARAGLGGRIPSPVHPHMLRHACGYKLANDGHDTRAIQQYLGHRNITHTVRYTELAPQRFATFWKD